MKRAPVNEAVLLALRNQVGGTQVSSAPPQPAVAESSNVAVDAPVAATSTSACGACGTLVTADDDRLARGRCKHVFHTACVLPLLVAGRTACSKCTVAVTGEEARAAGGYSIDATNDVTVRAALAEAAEARRNQVRDELLTRAAASGASKRGYATLECANTREHTANCPRQYLSVAEEAALLYNANVVPHAPGGKADGNGVTVCTSSTCGGPVFCVHRYVPAVSADAVEHWLRYAAPSPLVGADERRGRAAVFALLQARAPPSEWVRCGADATRLAALRFTLDDLVRHARVLLEDVVSGLGLTSWRDFELLGFHPSLLAHREHFPVGVLVRAGLRAAHLGALSYATLVNTYELSHEDLCLLGFNAPALTQVGMSGEAVLDALQHAHVRERGVGWWVRAMHVTPALVDRLFTRATILSNDDRIAYAMLYSALHELEPKSARLVVT